MSLYIVATPIGNLEDLSIRALRVLKSADIVLVEKWSDSIKLLNHYGIKPKVLMSYDERNKHRVTSKILNFLEKQDVALITSGGTPAVSDPGASLVRLCHEKNISVVPIPGPSALTSAMSASGFRGHFLFVGFLPYKVSHRKRIFDKARENGQNVVFFESPFRIGKTLQEIAEYYPEIKIFVGREMTKKFETYLVAKPGDVLEKITHDKNFSKGEFTLIIEFGKATK
jgi:16S rRNA (cytidine1402-2'-O)-methyltransferase